MEFFVDLILFPFKLMSWIFTNWQLVLLIIAGIFVYFMIQPILESNKAKAEQKRKQEESKQIAEKKSLQIQQLNNASHSKYAETNSPFSLADFLARYDFNSSYKSGMDLFMEVANSDLLSVSDKQIVRNLASQDKSDYLKSTNAIALLKADSRELQLCGDEILMSNYFFGSNGSLQDYAKVYEIASRISHFSRDAQYYLGKMYLSGFFVERSYKKAAELLVAAAIQGDAEAFLSLHKIYSEGLDVEINLPFAFAFLNVAYCLKPKKEEWKEMRDSLSKQLNNNEINLGQQISNKLMESNYRDLPTLIGL